MGRKRDNETIITSFVKQKKDRKKKCIRVNDDIRFIIYMCYMHRAVMNVQTVVQVLLYTITNTHLHRENMLLVLHHI